MDLTFREYLEEDKLIESFELTDKYKRLSKSEADKLWIKVLNTTDDMLPGLYSKKPQLKTYILKNEGREYLIYTYIDNMVLEVHFHDIGVPLDGTEYQDKKFTKNSQLVFSSVMSIVLKELEERPSRKIKISAPIGREKLYKKIIDKTLKKHAIEKDISFTMSKDEYSKDKFDFLLEKLQDNVYIEIK